MKLALMIRVLSLLSFAITATIAVSLSKPNCQEKCGNVTIPYPFGIGDTCSANSSFTVVCRNSTTPPKPFLTRTNLEVVDISLYGILIVNLPVSPMNCSDEPRTDFLPVPLAGSPFSISSEYNSLVVTGCKNSVWLRANKTIVGGCTAVCDPNMRNSTSCNGSNCCQIQIPTRLQEVQYTYQSGRARSDNASCGYFFAADKKWLQTKDYKTDQEFRFAPLVLEWEFTKDLYTYSSCERPVDFLHNINRNRNRNIYPVSYCSRTPDAVGCESLLDNLFQEYSYLLYSMSARDDYVSSIRYCSCLSGFEGNPYLGCTDIDECSNATLNTCYDSTCFNYIGDYSCGVSRNHDGKKISRVIIASIVIGSVFGGLILLVAAWKFGKACIESIKAIMASRKYMFFKRNGGLLLEQQLAAFEINGLEKTKLFTSLELAKATDDYNENRILGRGGEGVVYKGMLVDGRIVAVKKSERVNQGEVEDFINEVVIVSQINHRNVVKLLGCCLESEVPRLVYEFIPNGTLFSHIHHPHEDFPLFWEMRVRIAKQVAGALAYLLSAASVPIYHRDIKSTNILLDEKYRAKISDFGTSRSISIDQTHVTTRVVGTFGYLDPEYFQSSQFTDKSDVYSFGVVLVELLTGEKAISVVRVEEGRGLAMHFLHSMEENQVLDIIDARVLREGKREEIMAMAEIAKRCLHLNGKGRPTMKEVARDLDAIHVDVEEQDSDLSKVRIQSNGCNSFDDIESDFSSLSEVTDIPLSDES